MFIQLNGNLIIFYLGNEIQTDIIRCSDSMKIPLKAYPNSAGYDLFADESIRVMSKSRGLVSTGFKI